MLLADSKGLCVGLTESQNNAEIAFLFFPVKRGKWSSSNVVIVSKIIQA